MEKEEGDSMSENEIEASSESWMFMALINIYLQTRMLTMAGRRCNGMEWSLDYKKEQKKCDKIKDSS